MQCLLLQLQPDPNRNPRGTLAALSLSRKQGLATACVPEQSYCTAWTACGEDCLILLFGMQKTA